MTRIRVLLADDHALFREGLAGLLEKEEGFDVVGEARDGAEAVDKARQLEPDVVLMDISMPKMDGIAATQEIRRHVPSAKIVMLTVLEEDKKLFEAIKGGAHGYLIKNVPPHSLFETLRGVVHGEAAISRVTAGKIISAFAEQARDGPKISNEDMLSARERDVLRLLSEGVTNKEIGRTLGIAENTVKNHIKSILEKLHLANRVQAATYAREKGIVPEDKNGAVT